MADKKDVGTLGGSQPSSVSKSCNVCSETLPLTQFYAHPRTADGHLGLCKECHKTRTTNNRKKNSEYYLEYDRRRGGREDRVSARRDYQATDRGKQKDAEASKRWQLRNPEKRKAHHVVSNAIRDGKLSKSACEECGTSDRVHAHHDDYSKPLDVRWLCTVCHGAHHRRFDPQTGKPVEQLE